VTSTTGALTLLLAGNAVAAAPSAFVATLAPASLSAAAGTGTTLTLLKLMTMTKLHAAIAGAILVTTAVAPLAIHQHNRLQSLAVTNETLRQQLAGLKSENEALAAAPAAKPTAESSGELLRLRGEVARFRAEAQNRAPNNGATAPAPTNSLDEEFQALQARIALLKQKLEESPREKIPEQEMLTPRDWLNVALTADLQNDGGIRYNLNQLRTAAKDQFAPIMAAALRNYVDANNGELPSGLVQLKPYLPPSVSDAMLDRYELLHTGRTSELPSGTPIVGEKATKDRMVDSLFSIGLDRYQVKTVTQVVNGRGMRMGGSNMEMTKFIPGIQLR
jgi:hypothetical protein